MPDVREVFQMSTQKIKPDPGYVDRQHDHQRTTERRRKAGGLFAAAVIGLATVVAIVATRPDGNATPPANSTSPSPAVASALGQPSFVDIRTGAVTPISGNIDGGTLYSVSPDGTRIVYGHCCTTHDVVTMASNIQNADAHVVWSTRGLSAYAPAWSPDSSKIVYQSRDASTKAFGSLVVRDVATGQTTTLATIPGGDGWWVMFPSFSPDGRSVLFQVAREPSGFDLWSVPATGGTPTLVLRNAGFGQYFPDGKRIAFVGGMSADLSGTRISIASPDGTRTTLVKSSGALGGLAISPDGSQISYSRDSAIYVVDVSTGRTRGVASGDAASWVDNHTLIVGPR